MLDFVQSRFKYGFLYNGLKKNYYWWEFVKSYKKLLIVVIFNLLSRFCSHEAYSYWSSYANILYIYFKIGSLQ